MKYYLLLGKKRKRKVKKNIIFDILNPFLLF